MLRVQLPYAVLVGFCLASTSFVAAATPDSVRLLHDDFSAYRPGLFSSVVGAHTEYHYLPEAAAKGNWSVSTFRSSVPSQRAWRIVAHDGQAALAQTYRNKMHHYHPMVVTGDPAWRDYRVTLRFIPQARDGQCGLVFRYRNDRCYYFFGVAGQHLILKSVHDATAFHQPDEKVLAEAPIQWAPNEMLTAQVIARGSHMIARLNGIELTADDTLFQAGKVGLTADNRVLFLDVDITTSREESERTEVAIAVRETVERSLQRANPKPLLWKRIDLKDFGVGRNVRFGDLNGDGQIDILLGQVEHHGPKDCNSELSCLTAVTFEGRKLWQIGEADPWKNHLTNDVAFQIHDLDGDGKAEVVYCMNMQIIVADGATGKTKYQSATPVTPKDTKRPYNKFPRILGDSLFFCDLRGTGRDADLIVKDRYRHVWAFTDKLQALWHAECNTGHYPYAYDVDHDGKDELMLGYTLFDDDGTPLWSLDDTLADHADGVAIVPLVPGGPPRLLCAASDEGLFFADMQGHILKHHYLGHVQNPTIADFRPDLPGLESLSINFWGNQGIVHFYNAEGDVYHEFEPCQHGSMCLPINWTGRPGEFWVLSANVTDGGMFDGWGRRVVTFPADGHPDMCYAVLDITGDARDEVVVWDPAEMWVYTQDGSLRTGPLYTPLYTTKRNPLYNESNYRATVSVGPASALEKVFFHE